MASTQEVRRRKNTPRSNIETSTASRSPTVDESKTKDPKNQQHITSRSSSTKFDEYAWFIVFLLALTYFILTRIGGGNRNGLLSKFFKPYEVLVSSISIGDAPTDEELLKSIFYTHNVKTNLSELELSHRLEVIISSPSDSYNMTNVNECPTTSCPSTSTHVSPPFLSHLLSTTWVHDSELGRGYLLIADVGRSGRIWRWEVGGGPITIGRSLHMENSGCRSGLWVDDDTKCPGNLVGKVNAEKNADFARDFDRNGFETAPTDPPLLGASSVIAELQRDAERPFESKNLIVAEWGERRIIRVEAETGARTPLVTMLPVSAHGNAGLRRTFHPNNLMYTPFGDLLFSDSFEEILSNEYNKPMAAIYRLKEAVHVPPIPVEQSREAHSWTHTTEGDKAEKSVDLIFQADGLIDGMVLGGFDHSTLFVSVVTYLNDESESSWTKTVYKLSDIDAQDPSVSTTDDAAKVFYSITSKECQHNSQEKQFTGSKLAINEHGIIYIVTCPSSLALLSSDDGHVVGRLTLDPSHFEAHSSAISSVSFGDDGYLYLTTRSRLMRIKSRVKGRSIPTNMVVPPSSISTRRDKRDKQ